MADGRRYHHGDLRAAVIAAAVREVEAVGAGALSMREIARRAGVSHAAPAHHFGDKTGIFTAIAMTLALVWLRILMGAATQRSHVNAAPPRVSGLSTCDA